MLIKDTAQVEVIENNEKSARRGTQEANRPFLFSLLLKVL